MNKILLLGGSGLLGSEVTRQFKSNNMDHIAPKSSHLDVRDKALLAKYIVDFKPNWIVNCAAWTDVEGAEDSFEAALDLNEKAVLNIAELASEIRCKVIHISTNYIFDGTSSLPYDENAEAIPINKYGESKLFGERALLGALPTRAYVIRTSWLYGVKGKSFVKTIAGKSIVNELSKVVDDEISSPTSAKDLTEGLIAIINNTPMPGIYNFSNNGSCSWFELAQTIYEQVNSNSILVEAISSSFLGLKAKRPSFSLLSKEKWNTAGLNEIPNWESSLELLLPDIVKELYFPEKR
jgi:dTDP-4-dehydrorhamnose reductase